jgi:hypothetical protein
VTTTEKQGLIFLGVYVGTLMCAMIFGYILGYLDRKRRGPR